MTEQRLVRKNKRMRPFGGSRDSSDSSGYELCHDAIPENLHASKSNWPKIGLFLEPLCVPGSRKPFIRNGPQIVEKHSEKMCYNGNFSKYIKEEQSEMEIFEDMLDFLFIGNDELIKSGKQFITILEKSQEFCEFMEALDVIDSNPSPVSNRAEDCDAWSGHLCSILSSKTIKYDRFSTGSITVVQALRGLKTVGKSFLEKQAEPHSSWRIVVDTLTLMVCRVLEGQMTCWLNGHCRDVIPFRKFFAYGGRNHATRTINVVVKPDLLLVTCVKKDKKMLYPRSLTVEIGSQNVLLSEAFSMSETSQSTGSLAKLSREKTNENELKDESSEENEDIEYKNGAERNAGISINDSPNESKAYENVTESAEDLSPISLKVRSQHLLELIASNLHNKRIFSDEQLSLNNYAGIHHTAGLLWFNNAVFLTRLSTKMGFDLDEHPGQQSGKYEMCDKVLSPWEGHWKNIAKYMLVCGMMTYVVKESLFDLKKGDK